MTAPDPELAALVAGVLADLDGAGALADALQERGWDWKAVLLRRRWKTWKTKRAKAAKAIEKYPAPFGANVAESVQGDHDRAFKRYIRKRFGPKRKKAAAPSPHPSA